MSHELSDNFFNDGEMKHITRQRRNRDDCQVLVSWPRSSRSHRSDHHGPIGDVLNVHPPWLKR